MPLGQFQLWKRRLEDEQGCEYHLHCTYRLKTAPAITQLYEAHNRPLFEPGKRGRKPEVLHKTIYYCHRGKAQALRARSASKISVHAMVQSPPCFCVDV